MPELHIGKIMAPSLKSVRSDEADFETAISATGFGKFHYFLILIMLPAVTAPVWQATSMAFVFPAAQCDLSLSLAEKGLLNAITYMGMISSAILWGYLSDTLGRKKLLMVGYHLDTFCVVISSFSPNKTVLMVAKFLGGAIANGPFAALCAYISEFQTAKNRARMQLVNGVFCSVASALLSLLAWAVMPQNFDFSLFGLNFHSWNVFLLICAFPSFSSALIFVFMPESPKFLMTIGQNEKALHVFQTVYSWNYGEPKEKYPIKTLVDELDTEQEDQRGQITAKRSKIQALKEGWNQISPLFFSPHLVNIFLVCLMNCFFIMSMNTLRLWVPQIFQAINDFQYYNNGTSASLCTMLELLHPNETHTCTVNSNNSSVYINTTIISSISATSFIFAGFLINRLGKKPLFSTLALVAGSAATGLYFSAGSAMTLTLFSFFMASASISSNVIIAVVIDLFPTTLRTMAVSLVMMCARVGGMFGNIIFPLLLNIGCAPPFFSIATLLFLCAGLALFLPKTDLKALQ